MSVQTLHSVCASYGTHNMINYIIKSLEMPECRTYIVKPTILLSRVRQSLLEALAALAPFLPPAQLRLDPQDFSTSDTDDTRFFSNALQTRLMRKVLPSVSPEGLILYSLYIPNNPGTRTICSVSIQYSVCCINTACYF